MTVGLSRTKLQMSAQDMLDDATLLLKYGRFSNSYYVAGYAVELGLKACVAAQIEAETIPGKDILKGILSHEFPQLAKLAGLKADLERQQNQDLDFDSNWNVILDWSPDARYERKDRESCEALVAAIADPVSGVFAWIKARW